MKTERKKAKRIFSFELKKPHGTKAKILRTQTHAYGTTEKKEKLVIVRAGSGASVAYDYIL